MAVLTKRFGEQEAAREQRITAVTAVFFLIGIIILIRLFSLEVLSNPFYSLMASERQEVYKNLFPNRGSIYVREGNELKALVTNRDYYLVYTEPTKITDPGAVVDALTPILGLKEDEWKALLPKLARTDDPYEPIKHKVSPRQVEELEAKELEGIGFMPESYRYYPEKNIGGHLFGFVGFQADERVGQYGLEGYFNQALTGKTGQLKSVKDALGALVTIGPRSITPAEDGVDLVLTLDRKVQFTACEKLKSYFDRYQAERGSVIIMEPKTGAIIAMCGLPDFNPDEYNKVENIEAFNNPAIFYDYEPGSVFKAITYAAGLDTEKIEPTTTYHDTGEVKIGGFTIKNFDGKARGQQTMIQALDESLNTGAMFVAKQVGNATFRQYVQAFGFGEATGISLAGEVPGNISSLDRRGDIYTYTASFGQGITATPLQLAAAFSAIANNGQLMKPYVVAEVRKKNGEVRTAQPEVVRQAIAPKTATILTGMLTSVVETSYDKKGRVEGYYFAGKTGTAQVASSRGGYSGKTIHTFIGFGPTRDPKFTILVRLDNPVSGPRFASDSMGPLFRQLAEYLVAYYHLPPDY